MRFSKNNEKFRSSFNSLFLFEFLMLFLKRLVAVDDYDVEVEYRQ